MNLFISFEIAIHFYLGTGKENSNNTPTLWFNIEHNLIKALPCITSVEAVGGVSIKIIGTISLVNNRISVFLNCPIYFLW